MRLKKSIVFALSFCFSILTFSQMDKTNYALLWEVSGKDLTEKSWLFGSMHVRDVRAFEFPDSLIWATEHAEAFAMEVHPDEMVDFIMKLFMQQDSANVLRDMLSPEAYERLDKLVRKKEGVPIDSMDVKDPFWIEIMLSDFEEPEDTEKKNQPLDMFLYKLFYLNKKNLYGLEEMRDYQNLTHSFFQLFEKNINPNGDDLTESESEELFEKMLDIYRRGDLSEMEKLMKSFEVDEDFDHEMLGARNVRMTEAFLEIARKESLFGVVGTAHLPGKDGMVELLRKQGYTVRRVMPTFTEVSKNFELPKTKPAWMNTLSIKYGVEVQTPREFKKVKVPDIPNEIDMRMDVDLLDMNFFFGMYGEMPALKGIQPDKKFYTDMLSNWDGDGDMEIFVAKPVNTDGYEGYYFETRNETGEYGWWRIYMDDGMMYLFAVLREDETEDRVGIDRFFDSIKFKPDLTEEPYRYKNSDGAFSINLPGEPLYRWVKNDEAIGEGEAPRQMFAHVFTSIDRRKSEVYMFRYHDYSRNKYSETPPEDLEIQINALANLWGKPKEVKRGLEYMGCPAMEAKFNVLKTTAHVRVVMRGKRVYLMLAQFNPKKEHEKKAQNYFNSLEFLPFQFMELKAAKIHDAHAEIMFPVPFAADTTIVTEEDYPTKRDIMYSAMDTLSGVSYILNYLEWDPYADFSDSIENLTDFYDLMYQDLVEANEYSYLKDTTFQGVRAWRAVSTNENDNYRMEELFFFRGHYLYDLMIHYGDKSLKNRELEEQFFNSFKFTKSFDGNYFSKDMAEVLLTDLQSPDTLIRKQAGKGMDEYEFDVGDLPMIYEILEKDFPFDTVGKYTIYDHLLYELEQYTNDETTVPFLKKLYRKKSENEDLRWAILETLPGMKTRESFAAFFELANDFRKEEYDGYIYDRMFEPFRDTLELTAEFYPNIIELNKNKSLEYYTYNLILNLLRQNKIEKAIVHRDLDLFLGRAKEIAAKYNLTEKQDSLPEMEEYWHFDGLIIILGELGIEEETDNFLRSLQNLPSKSLLVTVTDALLMHEKPVERNTLEYMFESPYHWYKVIRNCAWEGTLSEIPDDLISPESTVKAYVISDIEDRMDEVTLFEILDKKTYKQEGEKLDLYVYKFSIAGYDGEYLGVCSQPKNQKRGEVFPKIYDYSTVRLTTGNRDKLLKEILEGLEE